jgi:glyoxylase-like metal-dependent hydrolase (beta-lactamase superfamily II)
MKYKVTALKMGELTVDKGSLTSGIDVGMEIKIPIWAAAIEGDGKKIVVDTGIHDSDWVSKNVSKCKQLGDETIEGALTHIGWKIADVDYVINTHLHYDHCGGNNVFKNSTFLIQRAEWENAFNPIPNQKIFYLPELFAKKAVDYTKINFLDGETTIFEGIKVIPTPGHCKAHQSVLVSTEEGVLCISADAANLVENIRDNVCPSIMYNGQMVYDSLENIRRVADRILPGHEPGIEKYQTNKFPKI